jgi:CheY-like chemotaxis protein
MARVTWFTLGFFLAERLEKIGGAGRHLLAIINDILDISRIEAGKLRLELSDFALSAVLDHVRTLIADAAQATRAIRALPGRETIPLLAMTANAFDEDRRDCIVAGMNDFVAKPLDPDALFIALLKWLPAVAVSAPSGASGTHGKLAEAVSP